ANQADHEAGLLGGEADVSTRGARFHPHHPLAAGAGAAPGAAPSTLPLRSPECPWNVRVGANSPSLWPTAFSVTNTGMNFRPLCTANVSPIISGVMVERRDHVLMMRFSPDSTIARTFLERCSSTKGPFLIERAMASYRTFRRCTIHLSVRLLLRVLYPFVGFPHGVCG